MNSISLSLIQNWAEVILPQCHSKFFLLILSIGIPHSLSHRKFLLKFGSKENAVLTVNYVLSPFREQT